MKSGAELIAEERQRQIEAEGYSPTHDDAHTLGEISQAARAYTIAAEMQVEGSKTVTASYAARRGWPWDVESMKVSDDPIRNLSKAGALIAAEIDRLQRLAAKS